MGRRCAPSLLLPALLALALAGASAAAAAQSSSRATVREEVRVLDTYPFYDPNPVPVLVRDPRLYPYHTFEGYSVAPEPREWKVVVLENDLIQVFVLPEVGGKVWGALVKETGHEFVYRNEVMKFRNIALRGPWTSGGIEFNFGVIGHTPATATPVDYAVREDEDGSASVFVGAMDLPSRTHWRVEIRLPPDRAYFETRALWYNPTSLEQPYYNWMTAAAFAREDLELFVPGRSYLEHSGRERPWPVDSAGRRLASYSENAFGGHKSYHVVGELNDFFGGYYRDEDWGWGHWARYEDMPGQKMWLWALSREGGVWEELLTDSDGQYVEFQAGRLLVQYSPGDHANPVAQAGFDPVSSSRWAETWFPLRGIGGLSDASREGAMHVRVETGAGEDPGADPGATESRLHVAVNAFGTVADTLEVWTGGRRIAAQPVRLAALEPFHAEFGIPPNQPFRVRLGRLGLDYDSDPGDRILSRPFKTDPAAWAAVPEADRKTFEGRQLSLARRYGQARPAFEAALEEEPWNREALLGLAELALRSARYEEGLEHVSRALQLDTYDARTNFLAGSLHRAAGRTPDARDAFGWAARSVAYRSASYVNLAQIAVAEGHLEEASRYAQLALDFDRRNIPALQALAVSGRLLGDTDAANRARSALLEIDPLHHFVLAEEHLAESDSGAGRKLEEALRSEYPDQSLLELAAGYAGLGLSDDASRLLEMASRRRDSPVIRAWRAFLADDPSLLEEPGDPAFAFPFRVETLPVLRWATERNDHWTWRYLLALDLWALNREEEAAAAFESLGEEPGYGPAYAARGLFLQRLRGRDPEADLARAVELDPASRVLRIAQIRHDQSRADWPRALERSAEARRAFPGDYEFDLLHARGLAMSGEPSHEALDVLEQVQALPSENSRESHQIFVAAHMLAAMEDAEAGEGDRALAHTDSALAWPERLGQGRPYDPEERVVALFRGAFTAGGRPGSAAPDPASQAVAAARRVFQAVLDASPAVSQDGEPNREDLSAVLALYALGDRAALAALASQAAAARAPEEGLAGVADPATARRMIGQAAAWLAAPNADPCALPARLEERFPHHFGDVAGRLLLAAARSVVQTWRLGRPASNC